MADLNAEQFLVPNPLDELLGEQSLHIPNEVHYEVSKKKTINYLYDYIID
jgi:hypothetical protein